MDFAPLDLQLVAELVSAAVHAVPHPLGITDYETVLFVNGPACALQGVQAPEQLIGQPLSRFVHPDMRDTMTQRTPLVIEKRQAFRNAPTKFLALDGSAISGTSHLIPIEFNGRPCLLWVYKSLAPLSPPPTTRTRAAPDDQLIALVFDALPDPMLIHDEEQILAANAACRSLLGASASEELVGRPVESIVHPEGRSAGRERRGLVASVGVNRLTGVEVKLVRLDGRAVRVEIDAYTISAGGRRAFLATKVTG